MYRVYHATEIVFSIVIFNSRKLSVNHPSEETQLLRFGKNLPFGHEVFVEVLPEVTIADDDIKYIPKVNYCFLLISIEIVPKPFCVIIVLLITNVAQTQMFLHQR